MVLTIGDVNIVPYIAFGGLKWQRTDVDGEGAGRDLSGDLHRNRVATKRRLDVTCRPLNTEEVRKVLTAIMPEFVEVSYTDPQEGRVVTKTMYSNNNPATFALKRKNGDELWGGITFPLIER